MLLVDAYNVLHVTGILPPEMAGPDVAALADLVAGSRWGSGGAVIVCDGPGPAAGTPARTDRSRPRTLGVAGSPGILVVHVGAGRDADGYIERMLLRDSAPRNITVVSSDRRLRHAARLRRARWLSSEAFLRQLAADNRSAARGRQRVKERRPSVPLDPHEVARWMAEFGIADAEAAAPTGGAASASGRSDPPAGATLQSLAGTALSVRASAETSGSKDGPEGAPAGAAGGALDPILLEAMKEWRGRLKWDDLNMDKWLEPETD